MSTTKLIVPEPINDTLTFRWFVEYVVDNAPQFQKASAIAKVSLLLSADLDPGEREVDTLALDFFRSVVTSEDPALTLPPLTVAAKDADGNPVGERQPLSPRVFLAFLKALLP